MNIDSESGKIVLQNLSSEDFLNLGMNQIAYIRPEDSGDVYAIQAADGTKWLEMSSLSEAIHLARHNNLYPFTLH